MRPLATGSSRVKRRDKMQRGVLDRPGRWATKLTRSLPMRDGTELITIGDARNLVLEKLSSEAENSREWHTAARCLLDAANSGSTGSIKRATKQVQLALFLDGLLGAV
jgi:hypothetical protein